MTKRPPTKKKKQSQKLFIRVRGSYLPRSWQAWLSYLPYIAYMVGVLVFVLERHEGFLQALFNVIPNWIAACFIMTWFAKQMS